MIDDSELEDGGQLLPKKTRKDKVVVYWVSYLDGLQRVLLFTQDERTAKQVRQVRLLFQQMFIRKLRRVDLA